MQKEEDYFNMDGRMFHEQKIDSKTQLILDKMPSYVTDWYLNLKASDNTPETCRDYVGKIARLIKFLNEKDPKSVTFSSFNESNITRFYIAIQTKTNKNGEVVKKSDSSRITYWYCLNNFLTYLKEKKCIEINPMDSIKKGKNNDLQRIKRTRKKITAEDYNRILEAVDTDTKNNKCFFCLKNRDKLILSILMTTGMRREALVDINIEDINIEKRKLIVTDKGEKTHEYFLTDDVIRYYNLWIKERESMVSNKNDNALFISRNGGERVDAQAVYLMVKKYSKQGLGYEISPHKIRGGFCSILYDEKKDIEFVRRAVGHSNSVTTQRYITTANEEKEEAATTITNLLRR